MRTPYPIGSIRPPRPYLRKHLQDIQDAEIAALRREANRLSRIIDDKDAVIAALMNKLEKLHSLEKRL